MVVMHIMFLFSPASHPNGYLKFVLITFFNHDAAVPLSKLFNIFKSILMHVNIQIKDPNNIMRPLFVSESPVFASKKSLVVPEKKNIV